MAQLSDDCFAFGGVLMTAAEALARLNERLGPVAESETVPIARAAGRILASNVTAAHEVPPYDNAAVDGYAVCFDDLVPEADTKLPLGGRIAAGHPLGTAARPGNAYRIFTGAPMPDGADTVLMQEDCREEAGQVVIPAGIRKGANRRFAGEDIKAGALILEAGRRLRPQDLGLAASVGLTSLETFRPLKVALFSTGDEIRDIGSDLPAGCIYDANRYSIAALLNGLGCAVDDLGILEDRAEPIRSALEKAAATHDLVMTSAGVSTGEEDHVRAAVESMGSIHFWRLAIRPGRPIALGQIGRVPFIGLPGNPVAAMVTFMRFARPAILRLSGCTDIDPAFFRVPAAFSYRKKPSRREWIRASLVPDESGCFRAEKFPRDGAGILSSMVAADGLVELAEELTSVEPGTMVDFLPFSEVQ